MSFEDNLRQARERMGWTQQRVADELGITKSTYCGYETGKRKPDVPKIKELARVLHTPADILLGVNVLPNGTEPMPFVRSVPRLGAIACGEPILAEQNIDGYDDVPDYIKCDFTLLCKGDSMINARIYEGDIVCIKKQDRVENGQIAAVLVNDEATLKRVRYIDGGVALWPENPKYEPLIYTGKSAENVRIIGLATHFISTVE